MFALSITGESIKKATDTEAVQEPSSSKAIEESPQETVNPRNTKETGLVHRLKMALSSAIREPKASRIIFENNEAAALKNIEILEKLNFKVENLLEEEEDTCLHPNNEFRDLKFIKPLFDLHENGEKLEIILTPASKSFKI
jgi:hypothetical protein